LANVEDVDGVLADREDDPMFVFSLPRLAVKQFADYFGEFVVLSSDRATQGMSLQGVDRFVEPVEPFVRGGGDICSCIQRAWPWMSAFAVAANSIRYFTSGGQFQVAADISKCFVEGLAPPGAHVLQALADAFQRASFLGFFLLAKQEYGLGDGLI
jgi:hypothetical protein